MFTVNARCPNRAYKASVARILCKTRSWKLFHLDAFTMERGSERREKGSAQIETLYSESPCQLVALIIERD